MPSIDSPALYHATTAPQLLFETAVNNARLSPKSFAIWALARESVSGNKTHFEIIRSHVQLLFNYKNRTPQRSAGMYKVHNGH